MFPNYKHHNTVKFLVGISPSVSILYVSDKWGSRARDQKIMLECGLLDHLRPDQAVMADRGLTVEDQLIKRGVTLIIPNFLGSHHFQLTAAEFTQSFHIAEARIHVEHAIECIKEFKVLQEDVECGFIHVLEQTFEVCAFVTNFQKTNSKRCD